MSTTIDTEFDEMTPVESSEKRLAEFIRTVARENSDNAKRTWRLFNEITPEAEQIAFYQFAEGVADVQGAIASKLDELDAASGIARRFEKSAEYEFAVQSERTAARIVAVRGPVPPPTQR